MRSIGNRRTTRRARWLALIPLLAVESNADRQNVLVERFDEETLPDSWSVVDGAGKGVVWTFNDPGLRGNRTGGTDGFAIADSFYAGLLAVDTSLVSPVLDLTGAADAQIEFDTDFVVYPFYAAEIADVDLSTDGGSNWANVWRRTEAAGDFQGFVQIPIPAAANQANVQIRFRHYEAYFDYWWQVDNVAVVAGVNPDEIFQHDFEFGTTNRWSFAFP